MYGTDQKLVLKKRLHYFRSLPEAERKRLRAKAKKLGEDRLRALEGHKIKKLIKSHRRMRGERNYLFDTLRLRERLAHLSPDERAFAEHQAMRGFHAFVRVKVLSPDGQPFDVQALKGMPRHEQKARMQRAMEKLVDRLVAELPEEKREAFEAMDPPERKLERMTLLGGFKRGWVNPYAIEFERTFLKSFLAASPAERAKRVEPFKAGARWYEMRRRVDRDLGIGRDVAVLTKRFGVHEWSQVRERFEQMKDADPMARRLEVEQLIRELHAKLPPDTRSDRRMRPPNGKRRGPGRRPRRGPPRQHRPR